MTVTAKSESEVVHKKQQEIEEKRRQKSYENLMIAQKRVKEYERHTEVLKMRKNLLRENLIRKNQTRKQRFEKNYSSLIDLEKMKLDEFLKREEKHKNHLESIKQKRNTKVLIKEELKKMKGEGILENLERIKRANVFFMVILSHIS